MSSIALDLTAEEQALVKRLRSLKVPAMADALEQQLKDPNADLNSFMERISMLVDAECQSRANKRFARLLKKASLRYPTADIDKSIYLPERQLDTQTIERLSTCHWIEEGKNLLVTGASASGKTFLVNALCITAMRQSLREVSPQLMLSMSIRQRAVRQDFLLYSPMLIQSPRSVP